MEIQVKNLGAIKEGAIDLSKALIIFAGKKIWVSLYGLLDLIIAKPNNIKNNQVREL